MSLRSVATRGPRPLTRWQVAHPPFPVEERLTPRRVAHLHRRRRGVEAGADEGDDAGHLGGLKRGERRHAGGGPPDRQHAHQVFIRDDRLELPAPQIDAGHHVAVHAVARRALRRIQARAGLDVGAVVLSGVILDGRLGDEPPACKTERKCGPDDGSGDGRHRATA